jgi:hypothetical protein
MRIRFAGPDSAEATAARQVYARADAFFAAAVERLRGVSLPADRAPVERDLGRLLSQVSSELMVEVAPAEEPRCRVVLSPASDAGVEPLLGQILRRAPSSSGVQFVRYRAETDVDSALEEVRDRFTVDLSDARVRIGFSRGHLLEIVVHSSAFHSGKDDRGLDAANFLVLRLIGDELFDDWVGAVDIAPAPRQGPLKLLAEAKPAEAGLELAEALAAVEAAIRGAYAGLPDAPYRIHADQAKWTLLETEPPAEIDYPAQDDVALKSTVIPEAMKCFLERGRFSSKRFSRHGETFAYVKVEAMEATADERHALRVRLEDVIGRALLTSRVGCVLGAGLGVRYVYIDVALENVDRGVAVLREALRRLEVDPRSWILFCDGALSREWVGVWDDAPPPPER